MHFTNLKLTQFRNYDSLEVNWAEDVNCIAGNNGAGKTNILEAIHFLAITHGFRRRKDKTAIQTGTEFFLDEAEIVHPNRIRKVQCNVTMAQGKTVIVDGKPLEKMSDHIGKIPLITVLPNETKIVDDGPAVRRQFMDAFISQYDHNYLESLIRYEKAMANRNALLAKFLEDGKEDAAQLEPWEMEMIRSGMAIHSARRKFVEEFLEPFAKYYRILAPDHESESLQHVSNITENTEEFWKREFEKSYMRDYYSKRTHFGTHAEDLEFLINEKPARIFASQGQRKTFVVALKLAQHEMLKEKSGIDPVLLLDDLFDKLDIHRLESIADLLENNISGQVFITDTNLERTKSVFGSFKSRSIGYFEVKENQVFS